MNENLLNKKKRKNDNIIFTEKSQLEIYRQSTLGKCLEEALKEMISENLLNPQQINKIWKQFDLSIQLAISKLVKNHGKIIGHLHTYRYYDETWNLLLSPASLQLNDISISLETIKIIAIDSKLFSSSSSSYKI
jgi:hypothetical protein